MNLRSLVTAVDVSASGCVMVRSPAPPFETRFALRSAPQGDTEQRRASRTITAGLGIQTRAMFAVFDHFFFRSAPPHPLALFRIGFGAFLLLYWGLKAPHVSMLFSREGIVLPLTLKETFPEFLASLFTVPSPAVAWVLYAVLILALLFLTIGYRARAAAAVAFLLSLYYWVLSLHLLGASFDRLFIFCLLVLAFSGCDRTYSLAMKLGRGSWTAWEPVCVLPQRILALQITVTYLGVGWQKIFLSGWQSGEILVWGFMGRWATWPAYAVLHENLPIVFYDRAVDLIKGWEFFMPFALWIRRFHIRWIAFATGALFHIGIAVFLGIWWFLVLIPAYVVFFEPEEMQRKLHSFQAA